MNKTVTPPTSTYYHYMAASLVHPLNVKQNNSQNLSMRTTRIPTTISLLQMCHYFNEVTQLHAQLVVSGLIHRPPNSAKLIDSYVSTRQIYLALSVFNTIHSPNVFMYNIVMRGLTLGKCPYDSLLLYKELLLSGLKPDNHTYTFVLKACSHVKALFEGKQVHCQIIKARISQNTHIHSSLIHMYANSGSMDSAESVLAEFLEENVLVKNAMISGYMSEGLIENARAMFDTMSTKDPATWSAMVTGYTKNGMDSEALVILREALASRVLLNESTLVSALSACAHSGALDEGRYIHAYINRIRAKFSVTLGTALVDMYTKCGCIETSYEVFKNMPRKDVISWGVIISGFATHGEAKKCFELFDEMVAAGISPNEIIFVGILSACSYAGYVEMGYHYFDQMVNDFGIRPSIKHYGCMVDLLGRAGRLEEAEELINSIPEEPNEVIWSALLNSCKTHKDVQRGRRAFRKLVELEPMSGDRYKQGGQMFDDLGEREDGYEIKNFIKEKNLETTRGWSSLEVDGIVNQFMVGDVYHSKAQEIYAILEGFN